jgi:hypothetical protein
VWFEASNNSGILYGDPLYSPVAVRLNPVNDTDTVSGTVDLSGSTVNGRDPAQTETSYSVEYCAGDDFRVCDQAPGAWQSTGIRGVGGAENRLLGSWDSSGLVSGSYTLRLSVTSLNTLSGRSQTLNDYYPVFVKGLPSPTTPTVQLNAASYRVAEDAVIVQVTVTRTGDSAGTVSVDFATSDGTALANSDYVPTSGTLTLANGVMSRQFVVLILKDSRFEGDETFNLALSAVSGGELGIPASAVLTITDPATNTQIDNDNDGVDDSVDNCSAVANPNQRDTDGDGFGNYCDGDFNNDNIVNVLDLGTFQQKYFSTDQDGDFNGDGIVNTSDLVLFRQMYFYSPGPGAISP